MYAVYHGPEGLVRIAQRINHLTNQLASSLVYSGYEIKSNRFFDTVCFKASGWKEKSEAMKLNFRDFGDGFVGISLDETTTESDIESILNVFSAKISPDTNTSIPDNLVRSSRFLSNSVFTKYRSETEMLRYMHKLELKDLSLNTSMIPLGSCTMKLNATTEMKPVTWPEFSNVHPFAPTNQVGGYHTLINELGDRLIQLTGFDAISMQPNSGAQGEYAGLMTIRAFHKANNQQERDICLIPSSAHGTNPASAIMAGMKVVVVECDDQGNIDEVDFEE